MRAQGHARRKGKYGLDVETVLGVCLEALDLAGDRDGRGGDRLGKCDGTADGWAIENDDSLRRVSLRDGRGDKQERGSPLIRQE